MESEAPNSADLRGNLQGSPSQAAWQALADAAKALLAIASAQLGKDVSCLSTSPTIQPRPSSILPLPGVFDSVPVVEVVNRLLISKAAGDRSDLYLDALRRSLSDFTRGRSRKPIETVTVQEIEEWVKRGNRSARTQKNRIGIAKLLFGFAKKRGWVAVNPTDAIDAPAGRPGKIGIHTPAEVKSIMSEAMRQNKSVARVLAIRYFAGLRTAEVMRMENEHIHIERGFIEVPAISAKTRRRRLVHIQPNLKKWLEATEGELAGDIFHRVEDVYKHAGVTWPRNVTRHSFCSYHLAEFQNAAKTALEAGHSEAMLFGHYRELVTPKDAAEYWAIVPGSGDKKAP